MDVNWPYFEHVTTFFSLHYRYEQQLTAKNRLIKVHISKSILKQIFLDFVDGHLEIQNSIKIEYFSWLRWFPVAENIHFKLKWRLYLVWNTSYSFYSLLTAILKSNMAANWNISESCDKIYFMPLWSWSTITKTKTKNWVHQQNKVHTQPYPAARLRR